MRHLRDEIPHVSGAEHVQLGRRLDGLHSEHFHLPSADEASFLREVVVQVELQLDCAALDGLAGLPEGLVLIASAADCAHRAAVRVDQHLCADALRRRSGR